MLKLIYVNKSLTNAKTWLNANDTNATKVDWNNSASAFYRSLVFTNDGHLLTHGLDFSSAASWGVGLIYNSSQGVVSSAAPTDASKTYFPTYKSTITNGEVSSVAVGWVDVSTLLTTTGGTSITTLGTITTGTWNASTITVPYGGTGATSFTSGGILYGNGTGAIQATAKGSNTQVLIGGDTPSWRNIITSIDLTHSNVSNNSIVTEAAVVNAIAAGIAANDAMQFKGITGTPTTDGLVVGTLKTDSAGYTWKVGTEGYFNPSDGKIYNTTATGRQKVEVGDLIICTSDGTSTVNATYGIVQTNIENPLSYNNLGGTSNGLTRQVAKDTNNYLYVSQLMRAVKVSGTQLIADNVTTALDFTAGTGLSVAYESNAVKYRIADITGLSAVTDFGIYKIKYNAQGQITGTSSWNPNTLAILSGGTQLTDGAATPNNIIYDPDGLSVSLNLTNGLSAAWDATNSRVTIGHSSTGATTNKSNSGRTYIQSLTIDSWGHVIGVSTATETVVNTWRPVYAWLTSEMANANDRIDNMLADTTGTRALAFSSAFGYKETTASVDGTTNINVAEIDLVWAEVAEDGTISYAS